MRKESESGELKSASLSRHWSEFRDPVKVLLRDLGEDGVQMLHVLLERKACTEGKYGKKLLKIQRTTSGNIVGIDTPTLQQWCKETNEVHIAEDDRRIYQRIVAKDNVYNTGLCRQDCVTIEGQPSEKGNRKMWLAKLLALLRIRDGGSSLEPNVAQQHEMAFI